MKRQTKICSWVWEVFSPRRVRFRISAHTGRIKENKWTNPSLCFSSQLIKILENYQEKLHAEMGLDEPFSFTEMPFTTQTWTHLHKNKHIFTKQKPEVKSSWIKSALNFRLRWKLCKCLLLASCYLIYSFDISMDTGNSLWSATLNCRNQAHNSGAQYEPLRVPPSHGSLEGKQFL